MASRFWVGGTGTWDASDTTHWSATSNGAGGQTVPGSGDSVTLDGSSGGGTVTVNTNFSITTLTMGAFTGTLDFSANNNSPSMTVFSNSGTGARTVNMGSGTWTLSGSGTTIWNMATVTNAVLNPGSSTVNCTYSGGTGTRTITIGTGLPINNFKVSAGTDIIALGTNLLVNDFDLTGFTGTWFNLTVVMTGSLTFGTGMTVSDTSHSISMTPTSAKLLTTNGVNIDTNLTINGAGGTVTLQDNMLMGSTRTLTITQGTFNANNKTVSTGLFASNNSNTRALTLGTGLWSLTGIGSIWNVSSTLTLTATGSTIKSTNTTNSVLTFAGGGLTYNNVWFSRGASTATNTITGANTFVDFKDDGSAAHTIIFPASTITTVTTFTVSGSSGNVITLNSSSSGTAWTLSKASGVVNRNYLTIKDSHAQGGANFYAGANSTSTSGNTGWQFFAANTVQNSSFFALF